MSKAFTRESDENESVVLPPRIALPPGVKNYITPGGAERLREELSLLMAQGSSQEDGPQREARIRQMQEIIASLVIAEPPPEKDVVRFGATVTLKRENEPKPEVYRIVGVEETNLDRNEISWLSPLGKVLVGKRAGDRARFRAPSGNEELEILSVAYEES